MITMLCAEYNTLKFGQNYYFFRTLPNGRRLKRCKRALVSKFLSPHLFSNERSTASLRLSVCV